MVEVRPSIKAGAEQPLAPVTDGSVLPQCHREGVCVCSCVTTLNSCTVTGHKLNQLKLGTTRLGEMDKHITILVIFFPLSQFTKS